MSPTNMSFLTKVFQLYEELELVTPVQRQPAQSELPCPSNLLCDFQSAKHFDVVSPAEYGASWKPLVLLKCQADVHHLCISSDDAYVPWIE